MKKIKTKSKRNRRGAFKTSHVNKLVVKPLAHKIQQLGVEYLKQSTTLLEKLEEINESIAIIAREMERQGEQDNKEKKWGFRLCPSRSQYVRRS